MPGPELETERLFLRPPAAEDVAAHAQLMADPLTGAFLTPDKRPLDSAGAWRTWAMIVGHWQLRGFGFFSLIDKQTGAWAGRAGPWLPEGWPGLEVGWAVHPDFRGRGYAAEAAIAAARWTFKTQGCDKIISLIRDNNANSRRVAEKLGESISGQVDSFFGAPIDIWSISQQEFDRKWNLAGS